MGTRWTQPDFEYRPRHHRPLDWAKVAWLVGFPLVTWTLVLTAIWMHWS